MTLHYKGGFVFAFRSRRRFVQRHSLMVCAGVSALLAASHIASAQNADTVEAVTVTGSKIARKDADSVGPLTTLTAQDVKNTASFSVGDILQKLPDAGVSYNSNGTQGTSFGSSSISLRYLANTDGNADRTLVLVDGHRWVDGTGALGIRDFADLNTIPIGMVGSIEVLQDGASAIYGADAIAGVVNIHTVQNLDGLSVNAKVGVSSRGDGNEYSGFANWGAALPHGSVFVSASYVEDQPVLTADRDVTKVSLTGGANNLAMPPSSPYGLYILPGISTAAHPLTQNAGVTVATGPGSYHAASLPNDYYNTNAQGVYAVGPSKRYGVYARVTNELTSDVTLTVDALYNRRISNQLYSPTPLSIGGTSGTYKGFAVAGNQAYNPFGQAFTASQAWNIQMYLPQVGNRNNIQDVNNYRFSAGLNGTWNVLARDFTWNLFGSFSRDEMKYQSQNNINLEHLYLGLGDPGVCATTSGCTQVNLFGQITPKMADYIRANAHETNSTQLIDLTADITGTLIDLPAGSLGVAAGIEYRRLSGNDNPDPYFNTASTGSGVLPLPASTPTTTGLTRTPTADGAYDVTELYAELNAPLLADLPMIKKLDLDVAVRFSDYSTVGSRVTSKIGLGYRPIDDLLARSTYSQAFRAPSLVELYTGQRNTNLAGSNTDPCNGGAAAHATLVGCAGIPASYNQNLYNSGLLPESISGNAGLKAETAETFSYGLAWTPHFIPGMSLTSDWYQVTVYNAISTPSATLALQLCAAQGGSYCSNVQRDSATGQVLSFRLSQQNLNKIKTSGVDTTWRYDVGTDFGDWQAVLSSTFLDRYTVLTPNPAGGAVLVTNAAGTSTGGTTPATARATYPRWKAQASLRWSMDDFAVMWRGRYIGSTKDGVAPALPVSAVKGSTVSEIYYNDLQLDYRMDAHATTFSVGVNNVFDQMPPLSYANAPINFDMYTYDVMGRYFFFRVQKDF